MDKTKEDFLNSFLKRGIIGTTPWPSYDHIQGRPEEIYRTMQAYADQEKRKEAISFAEWAADKGWVLYPDCDENEEQGWYKPSDDFDIPDERMFGGQLYDLYLQSLQPNTQ